MTQLPVIEWAPGPPAPPARAGTIADVGFTAELGTDGTWEVALLAC